MSATALRISPSSAAQSIVEIRKTETSAFARCGKTWGESVFEDAHALVRPHVGAVADGFKGVVFIDNS
jgi:hypothetical protein